MGSTSRDPSGEKLVREAGADHFFLDDGSIATTVYRAWKSGVTKILELVGTTTLADSLRAATKGGVVCMAGMVGNQRA